LQAHSPSGSSGWGIPSWSTWIAELGPVAGQAIPVLESWINRTNLNDQARIATALALIHIDPGHRTALRILTDAADLSSDKKTLDDSRRTLCDSIVRGLPRPNPHLAALIEPLARFEVEAWGPSRASFRAIHALKRIAPDRAKILYESLLSQPTPASLHAAAAMLLIDRQHEAATRLLVDAIPAGRNTGAMPLWALGEASSSNRIAIAALEEVVAGRRGPPPYFQQYTPVEWARAEAKAALARIHYREARAARGLPEEWW